jgi:superfamily I DNA/RNA helicase
MIDEAQDTNPARRALALRMLAPGGRLIAVGDPAQAIYGFTGADSDSMDQIKDKLRSAILPLNCTYRCPKQVVALARKWVPDITAHDTAPEGVVRSIMYELPDDEEDSHTNRHLFDGHERLSPDDVILCRNTAPLVDCAYRLLRSGIGCYVEGRNIGAGLVKLIRRQKRVKLLSTLVLHIKEYAETEIAKLMAREREVEASNLDDAVQTVVLLADKLTAEGKYRVDDLVEFIEHLFGDTPDGKRPNVLTLATIHKSKGREWGRVYLLGRSELMPSKWARQPWQVEQEYNLCYVAVTRAKRELVEVVLPDKKRKG